MASVTLNENDRESDDDDHVYDHLPPPPLVRQASSHADSRCEYCSICQERVMCLFGHLRMGCQCVFHYTCLLAYIRSKDRNSWLKNKGVSCPNSGLVNSCKASNYIIDFTELETLLALFENQTYENREIMFPNPLSAVEVLKYRSWIVPDEKCDRLMLEGEDDDEGSGAPQTGLGRTASRRTRDLVKATTKPCPSCGYRETHFHGHACHFVQEGCSQCRTKYCWRCLCSEEKNLEERGDPHKCICGYTHSFCDVSIGLKDFIVTEPYPHDSRCGCPLCPECKLSRPCEMCSGTCAVCLGLIIPGPEEMGSDWKEKWILFQKQYSPFEKHIEDFATSVRIGTNIDVTLKNILELALHQQNRVAMLAPELGLLPLLIDCTEKCSLQRVEQYLQYSLYTLLLFVSDADSLAIVMASHCDSIISLAVKVAETRISIDHDEILFIAFGLLAQLSEDLKSHNTLLSAEVKLMALCNTVMNEAVLPKVEYFVCFICSKFCVNSDNISEAVISSALAVLVRGAGDGDDPTQLLATKALYAFLTSDLKNKSSSLLLKPELNFLNLLYKLIKIETCQEFVLRSLSVLLDKASGMSETVSGEVVQKCKRFLPFMKDVVFKSADTSRQLVVQYLLLMCSLIEASADRVSSLTFCSTGTLPFLVEMMTEVHYLICHSGACMLLSSFSEDPKIRLLLASSELKLLEKVRKLLVTVSDAFVINLLLKIINNFAGDKRFVRQLNDLKYDDVVTDMLCEVSDGRTKKFLEAIMNKMDVEDDEEGKSPAKILNTSENKVAKTSVSATTSYKNKSRSLSATSGSEERSTVSEYGYYLVPVTVLLIAAFVIYKRK